MIRVFLVDDHALVRTGIRRLLEDERGILVVGEAESGEEALAWCKKEQADIFLMDMNMPGIGGIEATKKILHYQPDAKVLILTVQTENPFPARVMQAGAFGYLTKGAGAKEMVHAIRTVYSGRRYIFPDIAQQMALSNCVAEGDDLFSQLSERELQIAMMIIKGQKANDIAKQLHLSPKTVNSYRYRLFAKLAINGDVGLMHLAIRHGMLDAEIM
ncbi:MAG: UvrY/SirA/GacA family response regulator transcription factor [Enterovibrio sp.]